MNKIVVACRCAGSTKARGKCKHTWTRVLYSNRYLYVLNLECPKCGCADVGIKCLTK